MTNEEDITALRQEIHQLRARIEALEARTSDSSLPDWVKWVAMDEDGRWWGYEEEPVIHDPDHNWSASRPLMAWKNIRSYTPPEPVTDWRESKRRVG